MRNVHWIGILALAALLGAAGPATKPIVDLATPKAAVDTFAHAMQRGDVATALAASLVDARTAPFITAIVQGEGAQQALAEAAGARFGAAGRRTFRVLWSPRLLAIKASSVHRAGEWAIFAGVPMPVILKKEPGGWKMDWPVMAQGQDVDRITRQGQERAQCAADLMREINAGQYQTAQQAERALLAKVAATTQPATPPATTAPAAR
jgi:hypothetical protein